MFKAKTFFLILPFIIIFCSGKESIPSHEDYLTFEKKYRLEVKEFNDFLRENKLENFSIEEILRQGTSWKRLNEKPFVIPPKKYWENIIPTLKFLREEIIPLIGPVEILSAYRESSYNLKAGGARKSKHLDFFAVDLRPVKNISRKDLHSKLLDIWTKKGKEYNLGLGLYSGLRFHIDRAGYRKW